MNNQRAESKSQLDNRQLLIVCGFGVFFWFAFALLIKVVGNAGLFGGTLGILTFLLVVPASWALVLLLERIARLSGYQVFSGIALATAVASLLDGVALTWLPGLYGANAQVSLLGGGSILWGVGVLLILSYWRAARLQ